MTNLNVLAVILVLVAGGMIAHIESQMQANMLLVLPKPFEGNKVRAALGEDFILTCLVQSEEASPSGLRWFTPADIEIPLIEPTADAIRIYTKLKQNQLILHLSMIVPQDSGSYTCRGVQDGVMQEAKVELVLESKQFRLDTYYI